MTRTRSIALFALTASVAIGFAARAATTSDISQPAVQVDGDGVAIHGYDAVAYFTEGKPVAGSTQHQVTRHGATYRFASEANRAAFLQEPERYTPQYGGYCAWGLAAQDQLFDVDPKAWKIVDDKLYLNFNADVQQTWLEDIEGFIRAADGRWAEREAAHKK